MRRAIQTGKGPVGIDQTDDKSDAIRRPSGIIHKVGEDELGTLVRRSLGGYNDQDDEERYEGGVECH